MDFNRVISAYVAGCENPREGIHEPFESAPQSAVLQLVPVLSQPVLPVIAPLQIISTPLSYMGILISLELPVVSLKFLSAG